MYVCVCPITKPVVTQRIVILVEWNNVTCFGVGGVLVIFTCIASSTFLDGFAFCGLAYVGLRSNKCSPFSTGVFLARDLSVTCSSTFRSVISFSSYLSGSTSVHRGLLKSVVGRYWPRILLFMNVKTRNLYNWPHFCHIIGFNFQYIHAIFGSLLLDILWSISVIPFSSCVISVTCEMDDSPMWWTGQHLWVSLVSTVHAHLEISWCWTVLCVLPSKMSWLHLLWNLWMVPCSVLFFSVFLEDTPQAWNIQGEILMEMSMVHENKWAMMVYSFS